jgi:hypothetical protein
MLESAQKVESNASTDGKIVRLPESRFARDVSAFATLPSLSTPSGERQCG